MSIWHCSIFVPLTLCLCSCGATGGKKLAAKSALAAIESFDGGDTSEVRRAIATALNAGDSSREADMQISLHLESCEERLGSYEHILELMRRSHVLEAEAYVRKHGTAEPEKQEQDRIAADYEKERAKVKEWLKPCAQHLREDLGN